MADQELWLQPEVKPEDGHKYYTYALLYVDNILIIHHDAVQCLKDINQFFKMKPGSVGNPDFYLGAKLHPMQLSDGFMAWAMSLSKYIQAAVQNVKDFLAKNYPG